MPHDDRRRFLKKTSTACLAAGALGPIVGREPEIRVGLIGCGGRGSGAVVNALSAEPRARLVAMGDVFADRLESKLAALRRHETVGPRISVDEDHRFVGFDAYRSVIDASDVVILAETPHFRPRHLRAAIESGKHVFCEKPVAVDAPGVRSVMESSRMAAERGLSLVSGLCYRYQDAKREVIQRIRDGAIGEVVALQCTYNTGGLWHRGDRPEWSRMEYQIRNWLYFTWLSGDHIVEQSIHSLDKVLWAMGDEAPVRVTASGGRSTRTDPKYGNVFDHFNTIFEWKSGVRLFHSCRQWAGADADVSDWVFGSGGTAGIQHHVIRGTKPWRFRGRPNDMYLAEHQALFRSIREGEPINDGDYMCKSTLMAIMGRMSAYTGKTVTWERALASKHTLAPKRYAWTDETPSIEVARPGVTLLD